MGENLRVCRKCLLYETSEDVYFQQLEAYIGGLDEADRVEQKTYEERLRICSSCTHLLGRMCRICGCFVDLRAALKVRKCPGLPCRWQAVKEK